MFITFLFIIFLKYFLGKEHYVGIVLKHFLQNIVLKHILDVFSLYQRHFSYSFFFGGGGHFFPLFISSSD